MSLETPNNRVEKKRFIERLIRIKEILLKIASVFAYPVREAFKRLKKQEAGGGAIVESKDGGGAIVRQKDGAIVESKDGGGAIRRLEEGGGGPERGEIVKLEQGAIVVPENKTEVIEGVITREIEKGVIEQIEKQREYIITLWKETMDRYFQLLLTTGIKLSEILRTKLPNPHYNIQWLNHILKLDFKGAAAVRREKTYNFQQFLLYALHCGGVIEKLLGSNMISMIHTSVFGRIFNREIKTTTEALLRQIDVNTRDIKSVLTIKKEFLSYLESLRSPGNLNSLLNNPNELLALSHLENALQNLNKSLGEWIKGFENVKSISDFAGALENIIKGIRDENFERNVVKNLSEAQMIFGSINRRDLASSLNSLIRHFYVLPEIAGILTGLRSYENSRREANEQAKKTGVWKAGGFILGTGSALLGSGIGLFLLAPFYLYYGMLDKLHNWREKLFGKK
ncbi:MAG: hypothetical protein QW367_01965 [Candidatus Aenigmatarchaeota archaeon]